MWWCLSSVECNLAHGEGHFPPRCSPLHSLQLRLLKCEKITNPIPNPRLISLTFFSQFSNRNEAEMYGGKKVWGVSR